jgi:hypothetical protein
VWFWITTIPFIWIWPSIEHNIEIIAITVAVGIFLIERCYEYSKNKKDVKERLTRCYSTIEKELEDHIGALSNPTFDNIEDNKGYPFKSMFLNVDAYESLLHSGLFTYFPEVTQLALVNLYTRIKLHNEYQVQRSVIRANFFIKGSSNKRTDWPLVTFECDIILNRYQKEILDITVDLKTFVELEKNKI